MSLNVLFRKSQSSQCKEASEADGSISVCPFPCLISARRLALKVFTETTGRGFAEESVFVCVNDRGQAAKG